MITKSIPRLVYEYLAQKPIPLPVLREEWDGDETWAAIHQGLNLALAADQMNFTVMQEIAKMRVLVLYLSEAARGGTSKDRFGWGSLKWAVWGLRDILEPGEESELFQVLDMALGVPAQDWQTKRFVRWLRDRFPALMKRLDWARKELLAYAPMVARTADGESVAIVTVARNMMNEMFARRGYDWYIGAPEFRVVVVARRGGRPVPEKVREKLEALGGVAAHPDYIVFSQTQPPLYEVLEALEAELQSRR